MTAANAPPEMLLEHASRYDAFWQQPIRVLAAANAHIVTLPVQLVVGIKKLSH